MPPIFEGLIRIITLDNGPKGCLVALIILVFGGGTVLLIFESAVVLPMILGVAPLLVGVIVGVASFFIGLRGGALTAFTAGLLMFALAFGLTMAAITILVPVPGIHFLLSH